MENYILVIKCRHDNPDGLPLDFEQFLLELVITGMLHNNLLELLQDWLQSCK